MIPVAPAIHIGPQCSVCARHIPPVEAEALGGSVMSGYTCQSCIEAQSHAMDALLQSLNSDSITDHGHRCVVCRRSVNEIERLTGARKFYLHYIDGVMALLCRICSDVVTATMNSETARGRMKHISKEDFYQRSLVECRKMIYARQAQLQTQRRPK